MRTLLILLVAALAAGGAWLWWQGRPPEATLVRPTIGPAVEAVYATGTVEPTREAELASTETARIRDYPVVEGQPVLAGEVLVRLDDLSARADLQALQARVAFLESDLERARRLLTGGHISEAGYDLKASELEQAQAAAEAARQKLLDLTLVAPFDAVVLRKDHEVGEVVKPGDVLLWLGSDKPYWIEAQVDEEDIPRVALGQTALLKSDAFPEAELTARVAEITPMGDPVNKQYRVRLLLPEASPLMIGMTVESNIVVRRDEGALLVPEGALAGDSVFVAEPAAGSETYVVRRRPVETGVYGKGFVEIVEGLDARARIVAGPPDGLADGDRVRLRGAAAAEEAR